MKKFIFTILLYLLTTSFVYPCFDTYLFLRKGSMVYPYKVLVFELNSEYSFNKINNPQGDMFFLNGNVYYGIGKNFSMQFSIGSSDKPRDDFKVDHYGIRGVYNLYMSDATNYSVDFIAEQSGSLDGLENEMTLSLPNIFRTNEFTYVIHPTTSYAFNSKDFSIGGHTGLFYDINETGIIGIGAEYASVQSSSSAGNKITQSEFSTSLFLGAHIGQSIYLQNEIAKGLANSRDFGFALTTKIIL